MNKIEKVFRIALNSKVAIYVPATIDVDKEYDNTKQVLDTIGFLSDLFGGATATQSLGGWRCANGSVVTEKTSVVYSFCHEKALIENAERIIDYCKALCKSMTQESICLEINGQCTFIS